MNTDLILRIAAIMALTATPFIVMRRICHGKRRPWVLAPFHTDHVDARGRKLFAYKCPNCEHVTTRHEALLPEGCPHCEAVWATDQQMGSS